MEGRDRFGNRFFGKEQRTYTQALRAQNMRRSIFQKYPLTIFLFEVNSNHKCHKQKRSKASSFKNKIEKLEQFMLTSSFCVKRFGSSPWSFPKGLQLMPELWAACHRPQEGAASPPQIAGSALSPEPFLAVTYSAVLNAWRACPPSLSKNRVRGGSLSLLRSRAWGHYVYFPSENIGFLTSSTSMYRKTHASIIVCIRSRTVLVGSFTFFILFQNYSCLSLTTKVWLWGVLLPFLGHMSVSLFPSSGDSRKPKLFPRRYWQPGWYQLYVWIFICRERKKT